jgi:hypothetical protein
VYEERRISVWRKKSEDMKKEDQYEGRRLRVSNVRVLSTYHHFYDSIHCWIPDKQAQ